MKCENALDRMFEAEPGSLRGDGSDPELSAHLRDCARCRAVAATLARELAALDEGIGALADPGTRAGRRPGRRDGRRLRRAMGRAWVPLAAAAALAALLVLGRGDDIDPGAPVGVEAPAFEPRVAVTLPEGRGGAVMGTRNPEITVVWLYARSEP